MRVRERILAKVWRASRAEFNSRARSLYGIGAGFWSIMYHHAIVVVFFTLTDRVSTIPSNIRGCQSGIHSSTWSAGQEKDQRNIYQAPIESKKKHKQKRQRERNKNNKIYMPEKDRRRALDRESLAQC